ncbi:hypothetical protein MEL_129 [Melbournevirus]|uniref:hypothetical protein n=1 Tax=Melbournevirus TaxID=1560514 RepID=UPI00051F5811|nr:hypothetical protein MEL_129 [Melbournevirus]AIT54742.1 hypothetical protein MEL_129 [Melbournevirus]
MESFLQKRETVSWFLNEPGEFPEKNKFETEQTSQNKEEFRSQRAVWTVLPNGEKTHRMLITENTNFLIVETCDCKGGVPHGKMVEYTTDKKTGNTYLSREVDFVDGKLHGELWVWRSTGLIDKKTTFVKGRALECDSVLSKYIFSRGKKTASVLRRTLTLQHVNRKCEERTLIKTSGSSFSEDSLVWEGNEFHTFCPLGLLRIQNASSSVEVYKEDGGFFRYDTAVAEQRTFSTSSMSY